MTRSWYYFPPDVHRLYKEHPLRRRWQCHCEAAQAQLPVSRPQPSDYILKIFIEANTGKVEAAIQKAAETIPADEEPDRCERRSA